MNDPGQHGIFVKVDEMRLSHFAFDMLFFKNRVLFSSLHNIDEIQNKAIYTVMKTVQAQTHSYKRDGLVV